MTHPDLDDLCDLERASDDVEAVVVLAVAYGAGGGIGLGRQVSEGAAAVRACGVRCLSQANSSVSGTTRPPMP